MKNRARIMIGCCCFLLLIISWVVVISSDSPADKQKKLMDLAAGLMEDDIYILAVPLLEEAADYRTAATPLAEKELKRAYLKLIDNTGYIGRYTGLLEKQMNQKDAPPEVFEEAANYYMGVSKLPDALKALKAGIAKTGDPGLVAQYEDSRYAYETSRTHYDYVAAIFGPTVQVRADGKWGLARADGTPLIPCEYEKISTFCAGRAIAKKNGEIFAVDSNNNRVAKLHEEALDFGNYADNRIPFLIDGQWRRATGDFTLGESAFERIGTYSGGYAAAMADGKWGVVDIGTKWLIPAEYDGVAQDELGRCYAQGAVFVRQGGAAYLFSGGKLVEGAYEDARPFSDEGFAAVKRGGKWGFIDTAGTEKVGFEYDDALSFGQHLAAVRIGGLWGYISMSGQVVIEPIFIEAKSFSDGTAPVLTEQGWQFIKLLEYKKKVGL